MTYGGGADTSCDRGCGHQLCPGSVQMFDIRVTKIDTEFVTILDSGVRKHDKNDRTSGQAGCPCKT